ncbi:glycosyltransferase [Agromyces sp. ISL-38]|uniref:glycosyltransferase n=1 Tax=Agromyces sp. ISL-38 TaxID=2819107 RepID=UPI001BE6304E|nr:glycosyltransferase [Agromyces sp. ISL-38]MBT2498947.1 glycosyltransferase [Agromyces sp. ISL-38]
MTVRLSVVIPAHDEAAVIGRLLEALTSDPHSTELEIVVVANGCRDATVPVARAFEPAVRVVEIAAASKIDALEAGDAAATTFPRAYVDADVAVDVATLLALADALTRTGGPLVASPRLEIDTDGVSWPVRQHYRIWELTDYRSAGHIGSGIYAMSAAGRARFDTWPHVIADDRFVQQLFLPSERETLDGHAFRVRSARTLAAHLRRSTRIARGNRELPSDVQLAADAPMGDRAGNLVRRVARQPRLWVAFGVYCVTSTVPRLRARRLIAERREPEWARDETSRAIA